jgi:hypothetical protein
MPFLSRPFASPKSDAELLHAIPQRGGVHAEDRGSPVLSLYLSAGHFHHLPDMTRFYLIKLEMNRPGLRGIVSRAVRGDFPVVEGDGFGIGMLAAA